MYFYSNIYLKKKKEKKKKEKGKNKNHSVNSSDES